MAVKVPSLLHKMSASAQKAWYKKHGMEMPAKEKSAATAGKMKAPEPKKVEPAAVSNKPKTAREISMERQKAYYAKGGRKPIGAGGSGGHSSMAGVGQSSAKEIIKGIKAGINPKVALVRYTNEEMSPAEKEKKRRIFNLKLQLMKKAANTKDRAKPSKVVEPRSSLNPAVDMKLNPRSVNTPYGQYKEEVAIEEGKMKDIVTDRQETERSSNKSTAEVKNMSYGKKLAKAIMAKQSKRPIAQQMGEEVKDVADVGEYDYEGDMAKSQLRSILANAKRMHDMLEENTNLPEWVQSKITLAEDYILTAANYMEGEMNEEVEQIDEVDVKSKPVLHKGKEIGETGIDAEASPGVGKWYAKHHKSGMNTAGFDSRKEAESEVRAAHGLDEEAEGSAPTTPKEKELAKHHGDPNKITYGDVIKARLKSAAAKKMGK